MVPLINDSSPAGKMSRICHPLSSSVTINYRFNHAHSVPDPVPTGQGLWVKADALQHAGKGINCAANSPRSGVLDPDHHLPFH